MNFYKKLSQRGDTLVEVLICIIIIGTILTGGYEITNQSLKAVNLAQERANALQIAQSQLEQLRGIFNKLSGGHTLGIPNGGTFCISNIKIIYPIPSGSFDCDFNSSGVSGASNNVPNYNVKVIYNYSSNGPVTVYDPVFTVQVLWNQNQSSGQSEQLSLYYKIYDS